MNLGIWNLFIGFCLKKARTPGIDLDEKRKRCQKLPRQNRQIRRRGFSVASGTSVLAKNITALQNVMGRHAKMSTMVGVDAWHALPLGSASFFYGTHPQPNRFAINSPIFPSLHWQFWESHFLLLVPLFCCCC